MHGVKSEKMVGISGRLVVLLQTDGESLCEEFATVWRLVRVAVVSSMVGIPGAKLSETSKVVVDTPELTGFTSDEILDSLVTVSDVEVD